MSYTDKYCDKHIDIADKENKERYKTYKANRLKNDTEKKIQEFYKDPRWIRVRELVRVKQYGIDILEYYRTGEIVAAEVYHHIICTRDDWSKRLDIYNILGLTNSNHQKIHRQYSKDSKTKEHTQKMLKGLLWKFYDELA